MNSGFPVVAALILMGLILAIAIWDIIKARRLNTQDEDFDDVFNDIYSEHSDENEEDKP